MNRTLELTESDRPRLRQRLIQVRPSDRLSEWRSGTINADATQLAQALLPESVDLLVLDPPYNLNKSFDGHRFSRRSVHEYTGWLDRQITIFKPLLTPTASIYICGDWLTSVSIFTVASAHFIVRNRITWEREKGRGAQTNWKNASEDIWFCTRSDRYTFNVESVKLRRRVLAPYRNSDQTPRDWDTIQGHKFRDTHPSNLWTDITVPFWSMPENTVHPTQKSEKLIAKLVLASTNAGDRVFDPYLGSGTTAVVCKKLGRQCLGIDINEDYCLLTEKRLEQADTATEIQGLADGVFWERNTRLAQKST